MSTACALGALARKASYSADLIAVSDTFLVKYAGKRVHVSKRPPMSTGADNPGFGFRVSGFGFRVSGLGVRG